jgi:hypothetical protein
MTSRPFDSVGSGSEEQKYRLPRAHCRRGKPHICIMSHICRLGERGDPVSITPRPTVSAICDCKLADNRVDPLCRLLSLMLLCWLQLALLLVPTVVACLQAFGSILCRLLSLMLLRSLSQSPGRHRTTRYASFSIPEYGMHVCDSVAAWTLMFESA